MLGIENWQDYRRDGVAFLKTALKGYQGRKKAFNHEALYNIVCMAIEKLIMAYLMKRGDLAENHTMYDLVRALENHLTLSDDLKQAMLRLDSYQDICDPDQSVYVVISTQDIESFLDTGAQIGALLLPDLDRELSVELPEILRKEKFNGVNHYVN
mgnify:CR=1 FL=1